MKIGNNEINISSTPWVSDHGPMVSMVYEGGTLYKSSVCGLSGENRKADATLIQAAPDLLVALFDLIKVSEAPLHTTRDGRESQCMLYDKAMKAAKEAVEKAIGKVVW